MVLGDDRRMKYTFTEEEIAEIQEARRKNRDKNSVVSISRSIAGAEKVSVLVCPAIIFVSTATLTVLLIRYLVIAASSFFRTAIQFA